MLGSLPYHLSHARRSERQAVLLATEETFLLFVARRTSLVGKAPDSQPRGRGFDSR